MLRGLPTAVAWCIAATVCAAEPSLRVELAPISPPVRIRHAMPTVWDVQQASDRLREGRLRFRVRNEQQQLLELTTDEVVIHQSRQRLRFLLPPVQTSPAPELSVDVAWMDRAGGVEELGTQLLRVPFTAPLSTLMLVGEDLIGRARSADADRRLEALKLENLMDDPAARGGVGAGWRSGTLQSVVVSTSPTEFPNDPLAYTPYEIAVVQHDAFRRLRHDQLQAFGGWICAGGAALIETDGILESAHLEFLNRISAADRRRLVWQLDGRGRLLWPATDDESLLIDAEYGRAVIQAPGSVDDRFSSRQAREQRVGQWLWRMRRPTGNAPPRVTNPQRSRTPMGRGPMPSTLLNWYQSQQQLTQNVQRELTPQDVRLVPFWLVALVLGGLVMAIGPGEWWLLGRLRRRAWTWITWPVTTLLVTAGLVGVANAYLRSNDKPKSLVLHDLDSNGRIVRTNRFELLYASRSGRQASHVGRGLFTDQSAAANLLGMSPNVNAIPQPFVPNRSRGQMRQPTPAEEPRFAAPHVVGRVPGSTTVEQELRQWSPQLNRVFSIPIEPAVSPIDWTGIDLSQLASTSGEVVPPHFAQEIAEQLGPQAAVAIQHTNGRTAQSRSAAPIPDLVWTLTRRQVSGGAHAMWGPALNDALLDDLPVLDPDRPNDSAVLVGLPDEKGWTIYRRLVAPEAGPKQ